MGLAAYGRASWEMPLKGAPEGYHLGTGGEFSLRTRMSVQQLTKHVRPYFTGAFPYSQGDGREIMAYADFAASVQASVEQAMTSLVTTTTDATSCTNVIIVGGVAMNCSANGVLACQDMCDGLYIPPFAYDCGVAIGAALLAANEMALPDLGLLNSGVGAYLGRDYSSQIAEAATMSAELSAERLADTELADCVSDELVAGRLVGWYQGRAEVGQRALGARSILADPRRRPMVSRLNEVKGREVWRPLAPSVLAEDRCGVFKHDVGDLGRFMLGATQVREDVRPLMQATVHIDGTARPHFVDREQTPRYYDVIRAFRDRTGTPAVLNTSFNLAGEPIVCSPADAVATFLRSRLDVLVLDDYVLRRR